MKEQKFKLLFLAISILIAHTVYGMEIGNGFENSTGSINDTYASDTIENEHENDEADGEECTICMEPREEHEFRMLKCGHRFCTFCIEGWAKSSPTFSCPYCRREMTRNDIHTSGFHHTNKIVAGILASAALATYAFYRYLNKDKHTNTINKFGIKDFIFKKINTLKNKIKEKTKKIHASNIIVPVIAGSGFFTLLTLKKVNLSQPLLNSLYHQFGYHTITNNRLLRPVILNTIGNKHLLNACISAFGGLLAKYSYNLLSGKNYKSKNTQGK